ncbi:hypothetical protein MOBT1_001128 [Malassezia obtusa]|uniref:CUE domain-containing protein n=1 Tax=Malassezia obtusa TaxID=76774 RepID=A0AAF0DZJ8_9BASI|nr:hypothetical protein MOBT1_001128 [Malassezia obtusa]
MDPYTAALTALAAAAPSDVARGVLKGDVRVTVQNVLPHIALAALNGDAAAPRGAAALLGTLHTLQRHADPSLLGVACGGKAGALPLAVLADSCMPEAAPLVDALLPRAEHAAWLSSATAACRRARDDAARVPWRDGVHRIMRAVRLARCMVRAVDNDAALVRPLTELAATLAALYHGALSFARVPRDEASSSATPWPVDWLVAKVEVLCAADACLLLAQDGAPEVLEALRTGGTHVPDAVALVDQVLLEDLAGAQPECASLLPRRAAFAGAAWAAVRDAAHAEPAPDAALVDMVLAVLPQLERAPVVRRLMLPKYRGRAPEEVVEAFLDDPDGVHDVVDAPADAPPAPAPVDDALSDEVKATILARAEADDADVEISEGELQLLHAYLAHGAALFARNDRAARARPERAQLRAATGRTDDELEDWASMLARDPRRDALLAQAAAYVLPNLNAAGAGPARGGADRAKGGRVPSAARGGARGRGRGRGRGGGRGRGRGGGA